jgi:hypothetical protein
MPGDRKLRVFLCHASQDKPVVRDLYKRLASESWIDPWLDEEKLLPGQDWDLEIEKAVEASDAVVVCLSNRSVTKEGYVQKELRKVLDIALEKPEEMIFIIPLRLDDCELPRRLRSWHYVDYFPAEQRNRVFQRLLQSLTVRQNQLASKNEGDKKAQSFETTSLGGREEEKKPAPLTVIEDRSGSLTSMPMGILDLGALILPIFYFILAGLFVLGFDSNTMQYVWGIVAILFGIFLLLKRQIVHGVVFKISLILFLVAHSVVSYSNDSGIDLSTIPAILEGILAWIVAGLWMANFRSANKPAPYFSIIFAVFLFLMGAKLILNLYNIYPGSMYTLIIISAVLSSVLLWLEQ